MSDSYKIGVKGKVQGVWFRKYTKSKAESLGLNGYVRNEPNGDVLVEVSGEAAALALFIEWLHQGSPLSKVSEVLVDASDQRFKGFQIRY